MNEEKELDIHIDSNELGEATGDEIDEVIEEYERSTNKPVIYVAINEAMPGYIKIGVAHDLDRRLEALDNTSAPLPFTCAYACTVDDLPEVELAIKSELTKYRVRDNREFYMISVEEVVEFLKKFALKEIKSNIN